jgi:hypothetical protein
MKTWLAIVFILLQFWLTSPLRAEKAVSFSPAEFSQVKTLLCDSETVESLKAIRQVCGPESFTIWSEDLDSDGKTERLVFGPSGVCGAHGNCPLILLKQASSGWEALTKTACKGEGCLGWANSFATEVLPGKPKGYRDLLIGEDLGSFYWTKNIYQWNGSHYQRKPGATTYFLVDSNVKLVQVSKARWEQCSRSGKNCL